MIEDRKEFSAQHRRELADKGHALPDGSFPIVDCEDVSNAVQALSRAKDPAKAKAHIIKRAGELKCKLPDSWENRSRPQPGEIEERALGDLTVEDRKLRGVIPYGVQSADLGGWREVIEPRALHSADLSDLIVSVDHAGLPLGRYPNTLTVEDRDDGMHWACEPPRSRADVLEAVERGDLRSSSWRMVVARDRWDGNVRHIEEIRSLKDVAIVVSPAYPSATAELRSEPEPEQEAVVPEEEVTRSGGLTVESRSQSDERSVEARVLDAMRSVPKGESRSLTHATAAEVTPQDLQTFLWDLLRDNSVVLQSGVRVVTTQRKSIKWPTLTQDMEADFYNELDEIEATDLEFDEWELEPKKIAALARGSSEVFDDSDPDLGQIVNQNLAVILALKFDKECLIGPTSAKGFDGLATFAGQTLAVDSPLESYDPFIQAFGLLSEAHIPPPYAIIMHPRTDTNLALVKEFTSAEANVTLPRPAGFPPVFITSQVGLEDDTTSAFVYAPRFVTVVRRMDTSIEVDRSAEFTTDAVLVRGRVRVTIGTAYPQCIVKLTGLQAPPIEGSTVEDDG